MSDDIQIIRHAPVRIGRSADPHDEIWAIGDIHGRADLLEALLGVIAETPVLPLRARTIVSLGDVIDRGPESLKAIDLLAGVGAVGLIGNHEQMIGLASATREERWRVDGWTDVWLANGGTSLLDEVYGDDDARRGFHPALLPSLVGLRRWDWLRTTRPALWSGDVLLVHAGVDPARDLATVELTRWDTDQGRAPYWIRGRFLKHWSADRAAFVVHGHSAPDNVGRAGDEVAGGRLNADLGSHDTGGARAVRIVDDIVEIVDVWGTARSEGLRDAFREGRT